MFFGQCHMCRCYAIGMFYLHPNPAHWEVMFYCKIYIYIYNCTKIYKGLFIYMPQRAILSGGEKRIWHIWPGGKKCINKSKCILISVYITKYMPQGTSVGWWLDTPKWQVWPWAKRIWNYIQYMPRRPCFGWRSNLQIESIWYVEPWPKNNVKKRWNNMYALESPFCGEVKHDNCLQFAHLTLIKNIKTPSTSI